MNKIILIGRLTRDPETRYSQSAEPLAITRYSLAVNRKIKRQNEPDADFFDCTVFGKQGEFAEKYFKKGMQICVSGRLEIRPYEDQNGQKRTSVTVLVEDQEFTESKAAFEARTGGSSYSAAPSAQPKSTPEVAKKPQEAEGFYPIDEGIEDDDFPF